MAPTEAFAPAKINLTLHVTGQRADGYHLLDSMVVFADLGDRLWLAPAERMSLSVTGPFAQGVPEDDRNLVWKSAERAGATLAIGLEKNLPHGAGIGGGSSDAAAILRHLNAPHHAAELGADVPVCLSDGAQRMQGIGDRLTPLAFVPRLHLVLANPRVHVATPSVFRGLSNKENPGMGRLPRWNDIQDFVVWLAGQRNDLEGPAIDAAPEIGAALTALTATQGCLLARMSGSGSTCFGLYASDTTARAAALSLSRDWPDWWIRHTRTIGAETA